ncbi:MAG: hypothetical protein ACXAB9_12685 [Candidatus Thorarchaeota archaeon]|jgi:hypothetical protein
MNICVVGWYWHEEFLNALIESQLRVDIVNHRYLSPALYNFSLTPLIRVHSIDNVGLEWGAYSHYLTSVWDGLSPVLFTHDDTNIKHIKVFKKIADLCIIEEIDQAYIFRDKGEEIANGRIHGRGWYGSKRYLETLKFWRCTTCKHAIGFDCPHNEGYKHEPEVEHTGIWYDKRNRGHIGGRVPIGVKHYNDGVYHFAWQMGQIKSLHSNFKVNAKVYVEDYEAGRRNTWRHIERERKRMQEIEAKEMQSSNTVS